MLLLTAYLECDPKDREALIKAASVCAHATREEEGCFEYRFYEDTEQPGKFVFVERWRDIEALDAHRSSAHLDAFREVFTKLVTRNQGAFYEVDAGTEL